MEAQPQTNLDVTASPVQVEMQILDLAKLAKLVLDGFLIGLLVYVGHHDDPAFDGAHGSRLGVGLHGRDLGGVGVGAAGGSSILLLRREGRIVDFHVVTHFSSFYVLGFVECRRS